MSNKNWLVIEPFVSIFIKKENVLYYNTLNGKNLIFKNNKSVLKLSKRLLSNSNLYVVELKNIDLNNDELKLFIDKIFEYHMGYLLDQSLSAGKPVQLTPFGNVQNNNILLDKEKELIGEYALDLISEFSIYMGYSNSAPESFNKLYKQFAFPLVSNSSKKQLKVDNIKKFLNEIVDDFTGAFNFILGTKYKEFGKLVEFANGFQNTKNYFFYLKDLADYVTLLDNLDSNSFVTVYLKNDGNFNKELINSNNINLVGLIKSEEDYEYFENISKTENVKIEYKPYFSNNYDFFKQFVFLDKDDIFEDLISNQMIVSRQLMNELNLGKFHVFPNERVFSNPNSVSLGNINTSIGQLILKELRTNNSWIKPRKFYPVCKSCVYNCFCPPVSNYEKFIKKYDFCNVN